MRTFGSYDLVRQPPEQTICTIAGCERPARTIRGRYCEMHYTRMRRNGTHECKVWAEWRVTDHGYMMKRDVEHPLSTRTGYLYQHRAVLYDAIGQGPHKCHWCGTEIDWGLRGGRKLVVDHLDGDKRNNDRANLVQSCHRCNATRGLFQNWVKAHQDDPFLRALYHQAIAA